MHRGQYTAYVLLPSPLPHIMVVVKWLYSSQLVLTIFAYFDKPVV